MNFCNGFYFFTNACLRSLPAMVLSTCLMGGSAGCLSSPGSNQWYEKANPETSLTINPVNKTVTFYTNDGRGLEAAKLGYKKNPTSGESEFVAENLKITERSVENRGADAIQAAAMGQMFKAINESWGVLLREAILASGQALMQAQQGRAQVVAAENDNWKKEVARQVGAYIAAHPPTTTQPSP